MLVPILSVVAGCGDVAPPASPPGSNDLGRPRVVSGQDGLTVDADSTQPFSLDQIRFTRFAAVCGRAEPPFVDEDLYSLDIVGRGKAPAAWITVAFQRTIPLDEDFAVPLTDFGVVQSYSNAAGDMVDRYGQNTYINDRHLNFNWVQGSDPGEVDATPLTNVTLRFLATPAKDGDPAAVRISMLFADGGRLGLTAQPRTFETVWGGCPIAAGSSPPAAH